MLCPDGIGEAAAFLLSRIKMNILFEQNNNVLLLYSYTQKHRCKAVFFIYNVFCYYILLRYFLLHSHISRHIQIMNTPQKSSTISVTCAVRPGTES